MEMQDRTQFEKEWENAFADAEMDVSTSVWEKVELGVSQASAGKYKRRLLLFQLLAAASVVFAMTVGGVAVYHLQFNDLGAEGNSMAINDTESKERGHADNKAQTYEDSKPNKNDEVSTESEKHELKNSEGYPGADIKKTDIKKEERSEEAVSMDNGHEPNVGEGTGKSNLEDNLAKSGSDVSIGKMSGTDNVTANNDHFATNNDGGKYIEGDANQINEENRNAIAIADKPENDKNNHSDSRNIDRKLLSDMEDESRVASGQTNNGLNGVSGSELPEEIERLFEYLETAPLEERELNMVPWYSYVPKAKMKKKTTVKEKQKT